MSDAQLVARKMLQKHQSYLTKQQKKTLNGLIKAGDIVGAMNGLTTIVGRCDLKRSELNGNRK